MHYDGLLTCEHASNAVPRQFRSLFAKESSLLKTHRGYDIGAKEYASFLSKETSWPLFCGDYSRLLVDLNRSSRIFSHVTRSLGTSIHQQIALLYYDPFRAKVQQWVRQKVASGSGVVHLSCHSFTPVLENSVRKMDLGILYDPHRPLEKALAKELQRRLSGQTSMHICCNAPYKGISDGHVSALRKLFSKDQYIGIEVEVNQALFTPKKLELWRHVWLPRFVEVLLQVYRDLEGL